MYYLADTRPGERLVPRAVLVDCGGGAPDHLLGGPHRHLFHPAAAVRAQGSSAPAPASAQPAGEEDSCGAEAAGELAELTLERCRVFAEGADSLQGFMAAYSAVDGRAAAVAECLLCTDTFQDAFGKGCVCVVPCVASGDGPSLKASILATLHARRSEADAAIMFSEERLAAVGAPLRSQGLLPDSPALHPEAAVIGRWLDLFTHPWRTGASRSLGQDLDDCGIMWHPALKFVMPSMAVHPLGLGPQSPVSELVKALYTPSGCLLDADAALASTQSCTSCCYLSTRVLMRAGAEAMGPAFQRACWDQRMSLKFAGFVDAQVPAELQMHQPSPGGPASAGTAAWAIAASNHTAFGAKLEARLQDLKSIPGSKARLTESEYGECLALVRDYETAVTDLDLSSALGAPWC